MQKLKALIVDDEPIGRANLLSLLDKYCPEIKVIGEAGSAAEAKKIVYKTNPDVVFLDINMPEMSGFDFLESLPSRNFSVVFVSAHMEHGIRAVRAHAVDFLLKPVSIKELQQCVLNLVKIQNGEDKSNNNHAKDSPGGKIVLTHFQGFSIHDSDDIIRMEADDNYTKVYLKDSKPVTISRTLKYFEDCCGQSFFRIHKSHMINLKYLKEFTKEDGGMVIMTDGTKIAVSKRKLPEFVERIKNNNN
jgi:two-component system, LytTR family, response regulator